MGTLRIVAGKMRGRRIRVLPGSRVRPTPEKVREAVFDILGPGVEGAMVLDAFAGTGALGFEALSRGARAAVLVESDPEVIGLLRKNAAALGVEGRCRIIPGRVEHLLERGTVKGRFDVVFADPPYSEPVGRRFLVLLLVAGATPPGARIIVERDVRCLPADPGAGPVRLTRTARYGRTCLDFFAVEG